MLQSRPYFVFKDFIMNVALLQLPTLSSLDTRFETYLQACKKQKAHIVVLGEYVLNPFFREFGTSYSKEMISSISHKFLSSLKKQSKKYKLDIVAPLLLGGENLKEAKLFKSIALVQGDTIRFYQQQRLIAYSHWNEQSFFDNPKKRNIGEGLIFEKEDLKIAIIAGFEAHFDELWLKLKKAGVDIVLMPCSNTFGSKARWRNLCQMRAFTNSMAIVRVNRVGEGEYDGAKWRFYGDSLYVSANGEIEENLSDREGMVVVSLESTQIEAARKEWGFR